MRIMVKVQGLLFSAIFFKHFFGWKCVQHLFHSDFQGLKCRNGGPLFVVVGLEGVTLCAMVT